MIFVQNQINCLEILRGIVLNLWITVVCKTSLGMESTNVYCTRFFTQFVSMITELPEVLNYSHFTDEEITQEQEWSGLKVKVISYPVAEPSSWRLSLLCFLWHPNQGCRKSIVVSSNFLPFWLVLTHFICKIERKPSPHHLLVTNHRNQLQINWLDPHGAQGRCYYQTAFYFFFFIFY